MSQLVVVVGTGTGVGKTHVAAALVAAWAVRGARVIGLKPIESGGTADGNLLGRLSTFHVKRPTSPYVLARPVSPHLAARLEGRRIDIKPIEDLVAEARAEADVVVVETAGGLFTPLAPPLTNESLTLALAPDAVVLVAPDRLGVLHDIGAVVRAASSLVTGIVLSAPAVPDESTGTNAAEIAVITTVPVVAVFARASIDALVPTADSLIDKLV